MLSCHKFFDILSFQRVLWQCKKAVFEIAILFDDLCKNANWKCALPHNPKRDKDSQSTFMIFLEQWKEVHHYLRFLHTETVDTDNELIRTHGWWTEMLWFLTHQIMVIQFWWIKRGHELAVLWWLNYLPFLKQMHMCFPLIKPSHLRPFIGKCHKIHQHIKKPPEIKGHFQILFSKLTLKKKRVFQLWAEKSKLVTSHFCIFLTNGYNFETTTCMYFFKIGCAFLNCFGVFPL